MVVSNIRVGSLLTSRILIRKAHLKFGQRRWLISDPPDDLELKGSFQNWCHSTESLLL